MNSIDATGDSDEPITATVETIPHNGHIVISARVEDQLFKRIFIGHSVNEAKALFTEQLAQYLLAQNISVSKVDIFSRTIIEE